MRYLMLSATVLAATLLPMCAVAPESTEAPEPVSCASACEASGACEQRAEGCSLYRDVIACDGPTCTHGDALLCADGTETGIYGECSSSDAARAACCVAASADDCRQSEGCLQDGRCALLRERRSGLRRLQRMPRAGPLFVVLPRHLRQLVR